MDKEGIESHLSPSELKMSLHYSMLEWEKSQNLSHKIGNEKASVIEYDKVTLISIPLNNSNLLCCKYRTSRRLF